MLQEQKQIGHAAGTAFLNQRPLQTKTLGVGYKTEPPNFYGAHYN
jgi:hypothetical protein